MAESAETKTRAPMANQCRLCGQYFGHDGHGVWAELRVPLFDASGRHVVGFREGPMADPAWWASAAGVCVYCLANLRAYFTQLPPPLVHAKFVASLRAVGVSVGGTPTSPQLPAAQTLFVGPVPCRYPLVDSGGRQVGWSCL